MSYRGSSRSLPMQGPPKKTGVPTWSLIVAIVVIVILIAVVIFLGISLNTANQQALTDLPLGPIE